MDLDPQLNAVIDAYDALGLQISTLGAAVHAAETEHAALQAKYDALVNPPAPVTNPSGQVMPSGNLPGWELSWAEDFNIVAERGQIREKYGNKMKFYPPLATTAYYPDTSKRGRYETNNLTAHGGVLEMNAFTTADGIHHVCCFLPTLSVPGTPETGQYGAVKGGKFAVRFRAEKIPTYKIAWLLWPVDGDWPKNGEIDFPECGLGGNDTIKAFMHRQDAVPESEGGLGGSDQDKRSSTASPHVWHTCVTEWRMGQSCKFFLDGNQLGTTLTSRVPKTPMRWTFHLETLLDKSVPIDNNAKGKVEIDWAVFWKAV